LQARREVLQTTTDDREQNNTAPPTLCVGGPVTSNQSIVRQKISDATTAKNPFYYHKKERFSNAPVS